jgi:hypothetical protein
VRPRPRVAFFRRQKIWRRKLELSAIKPDFATKLCHLTSDFSGRISEAIAPEKNFQESLDAILRFAVKGVPPMMCAHPYMRREKTN